MIIKQSDQLSVKNRLQRFSDDPFEHKHASIFPDSRASNRTPYLSSTSVEANPLKSYLQTKTGNNSNEQSIMP